VQAVGTDDDVVAARFVVDLAQVVAHDLHVPVGRGREQLHVVDIGGARCTRAVDQQSLGTGGVFQNAVDDAHVFGDVHDGPEQIHGVTAGLAQHRRAFHHGDVEAAVAPETRTAPDHRMWPTSHAGPRQRISGVVRNLFVPRRFGWPAMTCCPHGDGGG
jgi:hypothetical protein